MSISGFVGLYLIGQARTYDTEISRYSNKLQGIRLISIYGMILDIYRCLS